MAGETPAGVVAHGRRGEGIEAELGSAGVDVLGDGLEGLKVGDVAQGVAGLLQKVFVDDDAVALVAVADGAELAVSVIEVVGVGVQLVGNVGAAQVIAVVAPGLNSGLVAHDEQRRGSGLVHLGGQGLVVGAGSGGHDGDGHAGLLGVHGGDLLQGLVGFGLEVQPVDAAGGGIAVAVVSGVILLIAAGDERKRHDKSKDHCKILFHFIYTPF